VLLLWLLQLPWGSPADGPSCNASRPLPPGVNCEAAERGKQAGRQGL
jgi:hypothetical protein